MEQTQLYGIGIYEAAIVLTDYTKKHPKRFIVSQEQLTEFFKFNKSVTLKAFPGLILMQANLEGGNNYLIQRPREVRKLIYDTKDGLKHFQMEMPQLLIKANISEAGYVRINYLGAFKGKLTPRSNIYGPALPNCNGVSMCNGGSNVKLKNDVMAAVDAAIYDTPFNHHSQMVGKEAIPFLDYVRKYKNKMPFRTLSYCGKASAAYGRYWDD